MVLSMKSVVVAVVLLSGFAAPARAENYRFEVMNAPVQAGKATSVEVRVTRQPTEAPVADVVWSDKRLHMIMGRMDEAVPVTVTGGSVAGVYRFVGDLTMYGEWTLDLGAVIGGEKVQQTLKFQVRK